MINHSDMAQPRPQQRSWPERAHEWITRRATAGIRKVVHRARYLIDQIGGSPARMQQKQHAQGIGSNKRDRLRQVLNVVFAIGQVVTTYISVATGANESFSNRTVADPPIIPAGYTFAVIWTVIYASTIAYAIFQALPQQRDNDLLRRIGFWTAAAFAGTSLWLVAAGSGLTWITVAIFFGILVALLKAFIELIRVRAPRTTAERFLVVFPISIYTAWSTIGTIANTAAALQESGFATLGLTPQTWAITMLVVAGAIASFVATVSRGNVWYVLTIVWALAGIVVANIGVFPPVAATAAGVALCVSLVLVRARQHARLAA